MSGSTAIPSAWLRRSAPRLPSRTSIEPWRALGACRAPSESNAAILGLRAGLGSSAAEANIPSNIGSVWHAELAGFAESCARTSDEFQTFGHRRRELIDRRDAGGDA